MAGATALALFAVGCPQPGDLDDPDSFCRPGKSIVGGSGVVVGCTDSATGGTGGMNGGTNACESACMTALITGTCKTCHGTVNKLAGTLDLETPGYTARLKDHPAEHPTADAATCPVGDKLVDSAMPANSWLLKKVSATQGACGDKMPSEGATMEQVACVTTYVNCVAGGAK